MTKKSYNIISIISGETPGTPLSLPRAIRPAVSLYFLRDSPPLYSFCVRARGADRHLGIDKGLAGVCPAISVVTAT
jgi:hypothetical protein